MAGGDPIGPRHLLLNEAAIAPSGGGALKEQVAELEKRLVTDALKSYGSARRAGQALGLSHTSILNKVKRYNLETYLSKR